MANKKQRAKAEHARRKRDAKRAKPVNFGHDATSFNFGANTLPKTRGRGSKGGAFGS